MSTFNYNNALRKNLKIPVQQKPIIKIKPTIKSVTQKELSRLKPVINAARARGKDGRIPKKVNSTGYEPQNGMTCVMNPTLETISRFGKPLYDSIMNDSWLSNIFFPVSPEGYHVTLIGMEYADIQFTDKKIEDIAAELLMGQNYLDKLFPSVVEFYANEPKNGRPGMNMNPKTSNLKTQCRTAEDKMKSKLGIYRKYPQNWHMTLGYFKPGTKNRDKNDAQDVILDIIQDILKGKNILTFNSPDIAVYKDHTQYFPLFDRV